MGEWGNGAQQQQGQLPWAAAWQRRSRGSEAVLWRRGKAAALQNLAVCLPPTTIHSRNFPTRSRPLPTRPPCAGLSVEENVIARTSAVAFGRGRVYTIRMQVGAVLCWGRWSRVQAAVVAPDWFALAAAAAPRPCLASGWPGLAGWSPEGSAPPAAHAAPAATPASAPACAKVPNLRSPCFLPFFLLGAAVLPGGGLPP